jgi:(2Fe-2S) ferredoxin
MSADHDHCVSQAFEDTPARTFDGLRYHVFVCSDGKDFCGCEARGGAALLPALRQELGRRRLMAKVKVTLMQCRQPDAEGPVLVVHPDGVWYSGLSAADIPDFVEQQILRGEPLTRFVLARSLQSVAAVPLHLVESGDCCPTGTPEERAAQAAS